MFSDLGLAISALGLRRWPSGSRQPDRRVTKRSEHTARCGRASSWRGTEDQHPPDLHLSAETCRKLGLSFWDYLGARLGAAGTPAVPYLPELDHRVSRRIFDGP